MKNWDSNLQQSIKSKDDIQLPEDDAFYKMMHDNIMEAIETTDMHKPDRLRWPKKVKKWMLWNAKAMQKTAAMGVSGLALAWAVYVRLMPVESLASQELLAHSANSPQLFAAVFVPSSTEQDFLMEASRMSLNDLTEEGFNKIIGEL